jgi:structural maintenance of chromosome 2
MLLKEIVIDGFKSYAKKTTIDGFDEHFNAITGLNGSGKSNILDAICFVLGITNLSQVRAGNLSELVYKQGQAGVTKATVTLVFDNSESSSSPAGYEQCTTITITRQVLLGGKSKYLINGRVSPAKKVQDLFHSVQLNVNNPHFLIMQGRITKVLNMKPHEILGMVEEAAGTRMYETKRLSALSTIDKKQLKLDQIESVLSEEILPTLEKLRDEKHNYLKWSKNGADMQRMERFVIAYQYERAKKAMDSNGNVAELETALEQTNASVSNLRAEFDLIDQQLEQRAELMDSDVSKQLKDAKKQEETQSKQLVKLTQTWTNTKAVVAQAEQDVAAAQAQLTEIHNSVTAKKKELEQDSSQSDRLVQDAAKAQATYEKLRDEYQNMAAGTDGVGTLPEQMSKAHSDSKTAEAKIQQAKLKIQHITKELKVCMYAARRCELMWTVHQLVSSHRLSFSYI